MTSAPQIRLRTIFLLFFCVAVGLTASKSPLGAIGATIEIAIAIGLLQQARELFVWLPSQGKLIEELSFARRFAIFWRVAVATTLGACVTWRMLLARQFIGPPDRNDFLLIEPLDEGLSQLCVVIALCNSLSRWRSARSVVSAPAIRTAILWLLGIAVALVMVVARATVEFLVHRAMNGIERSQKFRRTGLYIRLSDEGYDAIWFGLVAIVCLIGAIALVVHLRDEHFRPRVRPYRWLFFLLLLIPSATFCVWYHRYEFYRLSPDMAGAGLAIDLFDALAGGLIAAVAITAGAYQLAAKPSPATTICADLSVDLDRTAFHESFLVLLLLFLSACGGLFSLVSTILINEPVLGGIALGRILTYFCYPMPLLVIATLASIIQLCWVRWKTRSKVVPWKLHGLSPQAFVKSWIMLALLMIVGTPTVRAFAFLLWLGPGKVASLFGF
jgi:hypothetical protein